MRSCDARLGVDIGGTYIKWVVPAADGSTRERGSVDTPTQGPHRTAELIAEIATEQIAAAGRLHHVCLGTDIGRRSMLSSYGGGPGMDVLGRTFVPRLRRRIGADGVHALLRTAPRSLLAAQTPAANRTPGQV
jgi:hypothetical protein